MELADILCEMHSDKLEIIEAHQAIEKRCADATIKFMFWCANRNVPMFEEERKQWFIDVFGNNLGSHLFSKWEGSSRSFSTSTNKMLSWFFFELSNDNKKKLINWVDKNYEI